MFDKLEEVEKRYEEINELVCQSEVVADMERYTALMKELKHLTPIVEKFREYKNAKAANEESREMLGDSSLDDDFAAMVKEEFESSREDMERLGEELKVLLLPRDPNDDKNVIVEIRGGAGGEESALFAGVLYRMYSMYAESKGFKTEVLSASETGLGGYKEISFSITGDGAYSRFKFESGVHRVQRVPETESQGRIHTSTTTVAVLPEAEEVDFEILDKDLQIDTFRASGAGGQHINKTDSAIRITHLPTGIVVSCQNERSQTQNREMAMRMLISKLLEKREAERLERDQDIKGEIKKIEWGSQIRSYVFCPYTLVKDHRTGYETGDVQAVMNGDIQGFINDYLKKSK